MFQLEGNQIAVAVVLNDALIHYSSEGRLNVLYILPAGMRNLSCKTFLLISKAYARIRLMTFHFYALINRCNDDLNFKEITTSQSFFDHFYFSGLSRSHLLPVVKFANNYQPDGENCPIRNI